MTTGQTQFSDDDDATGDRGLESEIRALDSKRRMAKLRQSLKLVTLHLPHLTRLADGVKLLLDERVETAAVTPTGRILFNSKFLDSLTLKESTFLMAHEIYHLVLQTHKRGEESDAWLVNIAHDLIINDILEDEFQMLPPAGLLRFRGARSSSLEHLLVQLRKLRQQQKLPQSLLRHGTSESLRPGWAGRLQDILERHDSPENAIAELAGGLERVQPTQGSRGIDSQGRHRRDALTVSEELELFPVDSRDEIVQRTQWVLDAAVQSVALSAIQHSWSCDASKSNYVSAPTRASAEIDVLRTAVRIPWERVVQQWFDAHTPQPRTYARASRRSENRTDVVLPGRQLESQTVNVVLDTSGSMWSRLPAALGAITMCCDATGVENVRIVQCDSGVTVDEVIEAGQLNRYAVTGFGGWEGHKVRGQLQASQKPDTPKNARDESPPPPKERRRNRVISKRVQHLTAASGNIKRRRRRRCRHGDFVWVKLRNRPPGSDFQQINLKLEEKPVVATLRSAPDSNLAPAMRTLAADNNVQAVLIITDGEIEFPAESMPYDVLWLVVPAEDGTWIDFDPGYGQRLRLETNK